MPRSVIWSPDGMRLGHIDTPDAPSSSDGGGGGGCGTAILIAIVFVVALITQGIYVTTGTNVFDMFDGITGPCANCVPADVPTDPPTDWQQ
jgi:hypothetical protein